MNLNTFHNQEILHKIPLFHSLSDEELKHILEAPENGIEDYQAKEIIVEESDIGTCMYIVLSGIAEVNVKHGERNISVTVNTLRPGDFFGDQALLPEGTGKRNASVRALHPVKLFRIQKKYVLFSFDRTDDSTRNTLPKKTMPQSEVRDLIMNMRMFRSLTDEELSHSNEWTKIISVEPGEFVIKESEPADHLYIILEGILEVFTLDSFGKVVILARHEAGRYFGEQALLTNQQGKRNCYVRSNGVSRLIRIPKGYFRLVLNRDAELEKALKEIGTVQIDEIEKIRA